MIAVRTATEEGLYHREKLRTMSLEDDERQSVTRLLWSLFVLDRQFNFSAGLPLHLNEEDVDLPQPVSPLCPCCSIQFFSPRAQDGPPYLVAMLDYATLGAQVWNSVFDRNALALGQGPAEEAVAYLRYRLQTWQIELHSSVRFDAAAIEAGIPFFVSPTDECTLYLKTLLYLRSNQLKILALRPLLLSHQSSQNNLGLVREVVDTSTKSIRVLHTMSANTDIYRTRQVIFNHFLSSALAVLFLAAVYDAENQRDRTSHARLLEDTTELKNGLDLLDRHRRQSDFAARLWRTFARPRQHLISLEILGPDSDPLFRDEASSMQTVDSMFGNNPADDVIKCYFQTSFDNLFVDMFGSFPWSDVFYPFDVELSMPPVSPP